VPNDEDILAHPEQPRFLLSAWLWAVPLFVFFGVIVAIAFAAMPRGATYEEDRAKARAERLKAAQDEWNKTAESYGWVDKDKGVAHIPIRRAMELELADLQAKKPTPAGPIATPPPAEAPVTTPAAAPDTQSNVQPVSPMGRPISKPAATPPPPTAGKP
jgi:predicted outer membrane lipoprotein